MSTGWHRRGSIIACLARRGDDRVVILRIPARREPETAFLIELTESQAHCAADALAAVVQDILAEPADR